MENQKIVVYDRNEIFKILQDKRYHSPELSETDDENPSGKRCISVYDYSWRSKEV
jgi:hypothetical protein